MSNLVLESALFFGPPILAGLLAICAIIIRFRNLGATPTVWAMFGGAAIVLILWGAFIVALGWAGV